MTRLCLQRTILYTALLWVITLYQAVMANIPYDTSTCSAACNSDDLWISTCNFDDDTFSPAGLQCYNRGLGGGGDGQGELEDCIICDKDGLGSNSLAFYQISFVLVYVLGTEGLSSAVSMAQASIQLGYRTPCYYRSVEYAPDFFVCIDYIFNGAFHVLRLAGSLASFYHFSSVFFTDNLFSILYHDHLFQGIDNPSYAHHIQPGKYSESYSFGYTPGDVACHLLWRPYDNAWLTTEIYGVGTTRLV
ncbi:hypothetical protein ANO11243_056680 [Dothideomycetidae sp. 11243]|nr:hypothetical protein ANO11243_056680 [fungal sp. No.11243]